MDWSNDAVAVGEVEWLPKTRRRDLVVLRNRDCHASDKAILDSIRAAADRASSLDELLDALVSTKPHGVGAVSASLPNLALPLVELLYE